MILSMFSPIFHIAWPTKRLKWSVNSILGQCSQKLRRLRGKGRGRHLIWISAINYNSCISAVIPDFRSNSFKNWEWHIWCWMTPIFTTHKHFHMIFSVSLLLLILFYWETSFCIWNPTKIHNSVEFWLSMQSLKLSELSPHSDFISGGIQLSKVNESSSKIYPERRIWNGWKRVQYHIMSLFTIHWKLSAWKFPSVPCFIKKILAQNSINSEMRPQ